MNTITISEVGHDEFLLAEHCSKQYLISLMAPDIFFPSIKQVVIPQATMNKRHRVEKIKLTSLSPWPAYLHMYLLLVGLIHTCM